MKRLPSEALPARKSKLHRWLRDWRLYVMLLPALVWLIVFCYVPMYGILIAFKDYSVRKGILGSEWMGLRYFKQWFESNIFGNTLGNTLRISIKCLVFGFPMPIIFALMVNRLRRRWFKGITQNITYIPNFISVVVLVSMMSIFFASDGFVNVIARALGISTPITYADPEQFDAIYVLSGIWQAMGFNSIIYVAALSGINPSLYEAAKIDGASVGRIIWHIELPAILPTICMMLILNIGSLLAVGHDKILLMQTGDNIMKTEIISTYVYKVGVLSPQLSYSTAIGLFNGVVNFILLLLANFITKKTTKSGLF